MGCDGAIHWVRSFGGMNFGEGAKYMYDSCHAAETAPKSPQNDRSKSATKGSFPLDVAQTIETQQALQLLLHVVVIQMLMLLQVLMLVICLFQLTLTLHQVVHALTTVLLAVVIVLLMLMLVLIVLLVKVLLQQSLFLQVIVISVLHQMLPLQIVWNAKI
jgi:hypothetical protein